jgi:hypothetical protein
MMQLNEITVTWWCCRCNRSGRFVFHDEDTVGERLETARADHKTASPDCELDWNQVIVRAEIEEHGNRR